MNDRRHRVWQVVGAGLICSSIAATAAAQQPPVIAAEKTWSVTFYGGFDTGGLPEGGRGLLPPAGETFVPVPGAPPTRRVATWWLGDGATIVNDVFRLSTPPGPPGPPPPPALRALDAMAMSSTAERRKGLVFGARATRNLTRHVDLEVGVEVARQRLALTSDTVDHLHSVRGSFSSTFDQLMVRANRLDRSVSAELDTPDGSATQSAITGTVIYTLGSGERVQPFVLAGGGVLLSSGSVEYTLTGRYAFTSGPLTAAETDTLRVVTDWSNSALAVFGGGIRRAITPRSGVSVDARVRLSSPRPRTRITATPSQAAANPAGFTALVFLTTPSLAIVGANPLGFESNLSAPAVQDFTTFEGTGRLVGVNVSVGYFVRF